MSDLPTFILIVAGFFGVGYALEYALKHSRWAPRVKVWLSSRVKVTLFNLNIGMIRIVRMIGWLILIMAAAGGVLMAYSVIAGLSVHALLVVIVIMLILQSQKNPA